MNARREGRDLTDEETKILDRAEDRILEIKQENKDREDRKTVNQPPPIHSTLSAEGDTRTSAATWGASGGIAGPTPRTLFGLPLLLSTKAENLGTRGDLMLANLNYYALGMRKGASVESTNSAYWTQDVAPFR